MKQFLGYIIKKAVGKGKVSPTIKSVKPTKDISGSVKRVKSREYTKRIDATNKSKSKIDTGRKMMREGQQELRKMIDTGRAFLFKGSRSIHSIRPGENPKKQDEARVKKMGGGMMGRRFGMKKGSGKFPDLTGDGKVTFADILKGRGVINGKKKGKA